MTTEPAKFMGYTPTEKHHVEMLRKRKEHLDRDDAERKLKEKKAK